MSKFDDFEDWYYRKNVFGWLMILIGVGLMVFGFTDYDDRLFYCFPGLFLIMMYVLTGQDAGDNITNLFIKEATRDVRNFTMPTYEENDRLCIKHKGLVIAIRECMGEDNEGYYRYYNATIAGKSVNCRKALLEKLYADLKDILHD